MKFYPWEMKDLAEDAKYAGVVDGLDRKLRWWMKETGDKDLASI